jgi:hypothetical protein
MEDRMKLGAAVVGGYILGRTKKGRAALRLAMWLAGSNYRPGELVRVGAVRVTQSAEATKLLEQLRGPVMLAAQRAAQSAVEAQVQRLTQGIQRRTESLTGAAGQATEGATGAAGEATGAVREMLKPEEEEAEAEGAREEPGEAEGAEEEEAGQPAEAEAEEGEEAPEESAKDEEAEEAEEAERPRRRQQERERPAARKSSSGQSGGTRKPGPGGEPARAGRRQ